MGERNFKGKSALGVGEGSDVVSCGEVWWGAE